MVENINKKILQKFQESKADKNVKDCLEKILLFEIEHIDENKTRYKEDYIKMMRKYVLIDDNEEEGEKIED